MASVTLKQVHKRYGKVHAVRGISMEIQDGEFMAFLGPSGCGKSSTMRMIAGLEEITSGDILFDGESIIEKKPSQRNVAMAFETYALYPTLTVYENLAFPLRAAGMKGDEVDRRVQEVGEIIGITEIFDRKPAKLSSGQSQAVGLARALIRKPNVFLLDEPISHLDTSQRFHMRVYLKRLHLEFGHTMILVTHDQEDAMALSDRVAVMSEGILHQVDTPRNIYENPLDLFVAGFIGNLPMNFIDAQVKREDGYFYLVNKAMRVPLPEVFTPKAEAGQLPEEVVIGIRPYHISLVSSDTPGSVSAEIFVVEALGDMNVATVQLNGQRLQAVCPTTYRAAPHTPVALAMKAEHTLLFDKASGRRVPADR
ncbi:MAG TPA: ABC transporter ATP-binding protein [Chloroflexi bacterium]|nr:ABC transporter ATP-binding protein [Chloroflexota bacterium]